MSLMAVGVSRLTVVPSPSWELEFPPQVHTTPVVLTATLKLLPAPMTAMPESAVIDVGVLRVLVVPSPTWPELFCPHAHTAPADVRAIEWLPPAAISATPVSVPDATAVV